LTFYLKKVATNFSKLVLKGYQNTTQLASDHHWTDQLIPKLINLHQCCRSGIAYLTHGFGIDKNSGSGSGMNNPDHVSKSLETIFGLKYINTLMRIRNPGWKNSDPG